MPKPYSELSTFSSSDFTVSGFTLRTSSSLELIFVPSEREESKFFLLHVDTYFLQHPAAITALGTGI